MKGTSKVRRLAFLAPALMLVTFVPRTGIAQEPFKVTTVILVRHAEKQTTPPGDPPLAQIGRMRAKNLARILGKTGITTIITSQKARTRETARPLADAIQVVPIVVAVQPDPSDPSKVTEQSIKDAIERIIQHAGESVLVVGHTNTVPQVIRGLGGDRMLDIPEAEFDNLFIVTVFEKNKAKVIRLKY